MSGSRLSFRRRSRRVYWRRRVTAILLLVIAIVLGVALYDQADSANDPIRPVSSKSPPLRFVWQGRDLLRLDRDAYTVGERLDQRRLTEALSARLDDVVSRPGGFGTVTYRLNASSTARRAGAKRPDAPIEVVRRAVAASVRAPVVRQALRNTCESAALEVLLGAVGRRVGQRQLQGELPKSPPLDPQISGAEWVWGDPNRGYVGRPNGGGVAGGFGVYPRPIAKLAARHGVRLRDLSGSRPARVYERLLKGRPVLAWIGLSEGPYRVWRTPSGRPIQVNFGEHTVVLAGMRADGLLRVVNPLEGTRELWTTQAFESMWRRLGRRALSA